MLRSLFAYFQEDKLSLVNFLEPLEHSMSLGCGASGQEGKQTSPTGTSQCLSHSRALHIVYPLLQVSLYSRSPRFLGTDIFDVAVEAPVLDFLASWSIVVCAPLPFLSCYTNIIATTSMPPCRTPLPLYNSLDDPPDENMTLLRALESNAGVATVAPPDSGSIAVSDSAKTMLLPFALRRIRELEKVTSHFCIRVAFIL